MGDAPPDVDTYRDEGRQVGPLALPVKSRGRVYPPRHHVYGLTVDGESPDDLAGDELKVAVIRTDYERHNGQDRRIHETVAFRATYTSDGAVTIPRDVRDRLDVDEGEYVRVLFVRPALDVHCEVDT